LGTFRYGNRSPQCGFDATVTHSFTRLIETNFVVLSCLRSTSPNLYQFNKNVLFGVVNDGAEVSELGCFFFYSFQARSQIAKSFVICARPPAWNNSSSIARIFMEFDI
jgi:hypothetical protein